LGNCWLKKEVQGVDQSGQEEPPRARPHTKTRSTRKVLASGGQRGKWTSIRKTICGTLHTRKARLSVQAGTTQHERESAYFFIGQLREERGGKKDFCFRSAGVRGPAGRNPLPSGAESTRSEDCSRMKIGRRNMQME